MIEFVALGIWNQFEGNIDWSALPWICVQRGCDDIDTMSELLIAIRDRKKPGK